MVEKNNIKKWEELGFLFGIPDDKKNGGSLLYEEAYNFYSMTKPTFAHSEDINMLIFPLIARIVLALSPETKIKFKYLFTVLKDNLPMLKIMEQMSNSHNTTIDYEAEFLARVSEIIINKYKNK
jgi:hypothetical protein